MRAPQVLVIAARNDHPKTRIENVEWHSWVDPLFAQRYDVLVLTQLPPADREQARDLFRIHILQRGNPNSVVLELTHGRRWMALLEDER